ncbi:MAG: recombinase family protein [Clostridia bacterium]|nr:recombinase family protein [Clostridia bacterium]
MNKVCVYARYSSDSQTEQSIDGQLRVCREFAKKNNFVIVKEYIDRAMTGTNDNRPAFQQMLYESKQKGFDFVLVYKFDRFARSRHDSAVNKAILKKNGIKVISATELITDSPEGIILEGMLESFAEYYSAELAQKVKRGLKESRIKGQFTGGVCPFGYYVENKKVFVNEKQAELVKIIFNDYFSGLLIKDIVKKLNDKGIKNAYGKDWNINAISRILRNENYKGIVSADDTIYTNIFPAIIEEHIFDDVNERLKVSKRTSAHHKTEVNYLLSGKLICGNCGALMTGDSGKGKMGNIYNYYKCFTKKKNKNVCEKKSLVKQEIEDYVIKATELFLQQVNLKALAKVITDKYNDDLKQDSIMQGLQKELQDNNKKLKNLLVALENGIFNETTNTRMQELEIAKKELEQKIANRSLLTLKPFDETQVFEYLNSFKNVDTTKEKERQRLVDLFVNRVVSYDNKPTEIYFNVSDDKGTHLDLKKQPETLSSSDCFHMAERVGFEPT